MQKETISLVEYLNRTPIFQPYIKDILASTPLENLELSPDSLFLLVKQCVSGIHSAGNALMRRIMTTQVKKLIVTSLAYLCAILDDIAHSPTPSIVLPNFAQKEFIDLINHLRSLTIVLRDYSNDANFADEILQICFSIIIPFFRDHLIVAHPIINHNKQSLSETDFLYSHLHINNIVKFMHTCHAKIFCDRGNAELAMRSVILSQIAHEASRSEIGKLIPVKIPQSDYTATLRHQFKQCDNWRSAKLQLYMPFKENSNFTCDQSYINAMIYLMQDFQNLELAECFLDMGAKILIMPTSDKNTVLYSTSIPDGYCKLSELLQIENDINREVRCLLKAKKCYERFLQYIRDNRTTSDSVTDVKAESLKHKSSLAKINSRLKIINSLAFKSLSEEWSTLADQYTEFCIVKFDLQNIRITIEYKDSVYMKGLLRQLRQANIPSHNNDDNKTISINEPAEITINVLQRCFKRTQLDLLARRRRIEKALLAKAQAPAPDPAPKIEAEPELSLPASTLLAQYKNHNKVKPNKKAKPKVTEPKTATPIAVIAKPPLPNIDWGEDFPKFSYGDSHVYAFPNPEVNTNAMVKGLFFGYIDVDQLQDLNEELLNRFEEQLALGSLSNEDKAQGIRPITSSEANGTDYLYKINIGKEDLRLYGRKVAITIIDGTPRTLICFDQTQPHNKKLKQLPTEFANLNNADQHDFRLY